jgi:cytochrome c biogenesis protein CcdA
LRPTNAPTIFVTPAIDADLHQVESALARFIAPAVIILIYAKLLGWFTGWWITTLPDFTKAASLPVVVIPAALYYITPLRRWINAPHHKQVTERLRRGLVSISGYPDQVERYTWKKLRPLFFSLVDQDESLKQKAKLAYANGIIWTSCADSTAIAVLFFAASMALYWLGLEEAFPAGMIFLFIVAGSLMGSLACTARQIEVGAEQLETIDLKYKSDVEKRLNSLD